MKTKVSPNWSVIFYKYIFFPHYLFEVEEEKEKKNMGRVHLYLASFASCLFQNLSAWVVKHLRVHC